MRDSNLASDRKDVLALHDLFPSLEVLDRQRVTHPADVHDPCPVLDRSGSSLVERLEVTG
ncbi:hypothetical protein P5V30_21015 [Mycobacteroides abscessus subsp. abscessus]|uniref:hypothetical protein n=1 Tax=Mycobacteroides abscessus TaxID=36809 RepID=UPI001041C3A0|nr:hypothetical protein [Mycobacteroides abscessus]MDO2987017.1 hypothetical protein [Mycobacteroides abscessus subsp. abscessus]